MRRAPAAPLVVRVAPRFHDPTGLAARLAVKSAVASDGVAGSRPLGDWQPPPPDLLARLIAEPPREAEGEGGLAPGEIGLIRLAEHLRAAWWQLAAVGSIEAGAVEPTAFAGFAGAVLEFLRFKRLAVPESSRCEIVLSPPGRESTGLGAAGAHGAAAVRCAINLGDERAYVVLSLPAGVSPGATPSAAAAHSLLRVRLLPGDGLWLSEPSAIDGWTVEDAEPAVLLLLRDG